MAVLAEEMLRSYFLQSCVSDVPLKQGKKFNSLELTGRVRIIEDEARGWRILGKLHARLGTSATLPTQLYLPTHCNVIPAVETQHSAAADQEAKRAPQHGSYVAALRSSAADAEAAHSAEDTQDDARVTKMQRSYIERRMRHANSCELAPLRRSTRDTEALYPLVPKKNPQRASPEDGTAPVHAVGPLFSAVESDEASDRVKLLDAYAPVDAVYRAFCLQSDASLHEERECRKRQWVAEEENKALKRMHRTAAISMNRAFYSEEKRHRQLLEKSTATETLEECEVFKRLCVLMAESDAHSDLLRCSHTSASLTLSAVEENRRGRLTSAFEATLRLLVLKRQSALYHIECKEDAAALRRKLQSLQPYETSMRASLEKEAVAAWTISLLPAFHAALSSVLRRTVKSELVERQAHVVCEETSRCSLAGAAVASKLNASRESGARLAREAAEQRSLECDEAAARHVTTADEAGLRSRHTEEFSGIFEAMARKFKAAMETWRLEEYIDNCRAAEQSRRVRITSDWDESLTSMQRLMQTQAAQTETLLHSEESGRDSICAAALSLVASVCSFLAPLQALHTALTADEAALRAGLEQKEAGHRNLGTLQCSKPLFLLSNEDRETRAMYACDVDVPETAAESARRLEAARNRRDLHSYIRHAADVGTCTKEEFHARVATRSAESCERKHLAARRDYSVWLCMCASTWLTSEAAPLADGRADAPASLSACELEKMLLHARRSPLKHSDCFLTPPYVTLVLKLYACGGGTLKEETAPGGGNRGRGLALLHRASVRSRQSSFSTLKSQHGLSIPYPELPLDGLSDDDVNRKKLGEFFAACVAHKSDTASLRSSPHSILIREDFLRPQLTQASDALSEGDGLLALYWLRETNLHCFAEPALNAFSMLRAAVPYADHLSKLSAAVLAIAGCLPSLVLEHLSSVKHLQRVGKAACGRHAAGHQLYAPHRGMALLALAAPELEGPALAKVVLHSGRALSGLVGLAIVHPCSWAVANCARKIAAEGQQAAGRRRSVGQAVLSRVREESARRIQRGQRTAFAQQATLDKWGERLDACERDAYAAFLQEQEVYAAMCIQKTYRGFASRNTTLRRMYDKVRLLYRTENQDRLVVQIQKHFRGFEARRRVLLMMYANDEQTYFASVARARSTIQRVSAGFLCRRALFPRWKRSVFLKECVQTLGRIGRGYLQRSRVFLLKTDQLNWRQRDDAALAVQRTFRGHTARRDVRVTRCTQTLRRVARGFSARQALSATRWTRDVRRACAVLHSCCEAYKGRRAVGRQRSALRSCSVLRMQRVWKGHRQHARFTRVRRSGMQIQKVFRGFRGRKKVLRVADDRARSAIETATATNIQRCYRGFTGRIRAVETEYRATEAKLLSERSIAVQRCFRGFVGRKRAVVQECNMYNAEVHTACAEDIQRAFRGFAGRNRALTTEYRQRTAAISEPIMATTIQRVYRGHLGRKASENVRARLWLSKALCIQRVLRGCAARVSLHLAHSRVRLQELVCRLQRGCEDREVVNRLRHKERLQMLSRASLSLQRIGRAFARRGAVWRASMHIVCTKAALTLQQAYRSYSSVCKLTYLRRMKQDKEVITARPSHHRATVPVGTFVRLRYFDGVDASEKNGALARVLRHVYPHSVSLVLLGTRALTTVPLYAVTQACAASAAPR